MPDQIFRRHERHKTYLKKSAAEYKNKNSQQKLCLDSEIQSGVQKLDAFRDAKVQRLTLTKDAVQYRGKKQERTALINQS